MSILTAQKYEIKWRMKNREWKIISVGRKLYICTMISFYLCLFILVSYFVTAQELRCNISVSSQKIQGTNRELFTNIQRDMYEFLNNKRWSENIFQYDERIECSIQITLDEQIGSDQFRGSMQVRVSRPVYNSSYSTVLLNFRDNDIDYIYREFEPLEYSETGQNSNLVNLLAPPYGNPSPYKPRIHFPPRQYSIRRGRSTRPKSPPCSFHQSIRSARRELKQW